MPKDETATRSVGSNGNHAVETPQDEQDALWRQRQRNNRIVALVLAAFCLLVFVWIVVRMAGGH